MKRFLSLLLFLPCLSALAATNTFPPLATREFVTNYVAAFGGSGSVTNIPYGATWDNVTNTAPSLDSVFEKIETLVLSGGGDVTQAGTNNFSGSNAFIGSITVPNQALTNSSTAAANTAFVSSNIALVTFSGDMQGRVLTNVGGIYFTNAVGTNTFATVIVTNLYVPGLNSTNLGVDANGKVIAVAGGSGVSSWNDLTDIPAGFSDNIDNTGGSTNITDSGTSVTVAGGLTINGDFTVNGTNSAVWSFADADSTDPEKVDLGAPNNITNSYALEFAGDTNGTPGYLFATQDGTNRLGKPNLKLTFKTPTSSGVAVADIDTSLELRNIVSDEIGDGYLLFSGNNLYQPTNANLTSAATRAILIERGTNLLSYSTLTNAFYNLQSGDTMTIGGGTWNVNGHYYTTDVGDLSNITNLWVRGLSNVTIRGVGMGTILVITNYGNGITLDSVRNITIRDLAIVGSTNGMSASTWIVSAINHRRTNDNTRIFNVNFKDIPDQAISHTCDEYGRPSTSWIVQNCRFENIGQTLHPNTSLPDGSCVSGAPANLVFTGNFGTNLNAIAVEFDTRGDDVTGTDYGDGLVSGNVLLGTYDAAVGLPQWYTNRQSRITITGNTFAERASGYRVTGHAMIPLYGNSDITIAGNTFSASSASPISFVTLGDGLGNYTNVFCTNIVISANVFSGGGYGIYSDAGSYGVTVTGNSFKEQGLNSVQLWANGFNVSGNTFLGNSRNSSDTYAFMLFSNDARVGNDNGLIANNVFNDTLATPRMGGAVYLVCNNTPTNIVVVNNTIGAITNGAAPYKYLNAAAATSISPSSLQSSNNILGNALLATGDGDTQFPAIGFNGNRDVGFYRSGGNIVATTDNNHSFVMRTDGIALDYGNWIGWYNDVNWTNVDTSIRRAGVNLLDFQYATLTNIDTIRLSTSPAGDDDSKRVATTEWVQDEIAGISGGSLPTYSGSYGGTLRIHPIAGTNFWQTPENSVWLFDEFLGDSTGDWNWTRTTSGTGATAFGATATTNAAGILSFDAGSVTNGRVSISFSSPSVALGGGSVFTAYRVIPPSTLSTDADTYVLRVGMCDNNGASGEGTDGVFFRYGTNYSSGANWECVVRKASMETVASSGLAVAANTPVRLSIKVDSTGGTATFYTNNVQCAAITSANIPTGSAATSAGLFQIERIGGTAPGTRRFNIDWFFFFKSYVD